MTRHGPDAFGHILWGSVLVTGLLVAGTVGLGAATAKPFEFWCKAVMFTLGFTHFAVGYLFMGAARKAGGASPGGLLTLVACAALAVAYYVRPMAPLVYTVVYCHFAENAVYQMYRRAAPEGAGDAGAVFPFVTSLVALRAVAVWRAEYDPWTQGAVMLGFLAITRTQLPASDWRAGLAAMRRRPALLGGFAAVAVLLHDLTWAWDAFIIWHYMTWILYQWQGDPALRGRLVGAHAVFGGVYAGLVGTVMWYGPGLATPARDLLYAVAGGVSFQAQTLMHVLVTLAFRRYGPRG